MQVAAGALPTTTESSGGHVLVHVPHALASNDRKVQSAHNPYKLPKPHDKESAGSAESGQLDFHCPGISGVSDKLTASNMAASVYHTENTAGWYTSTTAFRDWGSDRHLYIHSLNKSSTHEGASNSITGVWGCFFDSVHHVYLSLGLLLQNL